MNIERKSEQRTERPEYSFDEGLEEAFNRAKELLEGQDNVVIAINVPSIEDQAVGKTTLSQQLTLKCKQEGIPAFSVSQPDAMSSYVGGFKDAAKAFGKKGGVIIFSEMGSIDVIPPAKIKLYKKGMNKRVNSGGEKSGLQLSGVDIWISLYRPDRPHGKENGKKLIGDVVICNEKAEDK
ncbi:hypothetical protein KKC88_06010 [Patescibacteria group bacterium]|nr:hypothetical protein [Patescibacteria group bacterium]MBU1673676.1 hypothetical protein [Patescibacteria group bacterium]MBU1963836.1 hypothetical protein [Patescibacteria group bacterium]